MTSTETDNPVVVRQIDAPTDAVLIRALGAGERAGCAWLQPKPCSNRGSLQLAYYDPTGVHGDDGNYCGALYACSVQHAVHILRERGIIWLPTVPVSS